jgi:uncharacterized membrane protein YdbT with pleckstrin-like domain
MSGTASSDNSAAETVLWVGHPSQLLHFWFYFLLFLVAVASVVLVSFLGPLTLIALPVVAVVWGVRWWLTRTTEYKLTTQRFKTRFGILNRRLDELELFRVRDQAMEQPILMRLFGIGNLILTTADATCPTVYLRAIPEVDKVREMFRATVQTERDRRRVRPLDMVDGPDATLG